MDTKFTVKEIGVAIKVIATLNEQIFVSNKDFDTFEQANEFITKINREQRMNAEIDVKNLEKHANNYPYWVVRLEDGEFWFWGAWKIKDEAEKVAKELGGAVVKNKNF